MIQKCRPLDWDEKKNQPTGPNTPSIAASKKTISERTWMRSPACSIATRPRGVLNARGVFLACSASSHSADMDRLYTLLLLLALPLPLLLRLLLLLLRLLRLMRLLLLLVLPFTFLVPLLVKCFALAHGWDLEGRVNSRAIPTLHRRWRRRRVASKTL